MGASLLALLSSLLWGTGDFLGGTISRRVHPVAVMQATQGIAAAGLVVVVVATGEVGRTGAIGWGAAAGLAGFVGLGCFYAALAAGTMGVVAPIAATGVVIPVVVGLAQGDRPALVQLLGMAVTVGGVIAASGPERHDPLPHPHDDPTDPTGATGPTHPHDDPTDPTGATGPTEPARAEVGTGGRPIDRWRPFLLAGVAAVCFGSALTLLAEGSEVSVAMSLLVMRLVNAGICTVLLLTVLRRVARPHRGDVGVLAAIGTTDATANGTYAVASTIGSLSVSAVLASLYPAVTALLAWKVHGERLTRIQVGGVAATLVGVAMIAGG